MLIYFQMIKSQSDREKFEEIYTAYRRLMLYVANEILKNRQDAEDAVQEALISVAANIKMISQAVCRKTRALIVIIVRRKATDILRKRQREQTVELDEAALLPAPPVEDGGSLRAAMDALPERQREILYLYYYIGYSVREIAKLLDMKPSAVYKFMERTKEKLRDILEREGSAR